MRNRWGKQPSQIKVFIVGLGVLVALPSLFGWIWWIISPTTPEQRSEVVKVFAQIAGASVLAIGGFFTWRNLRVAEANQIENQQANRTREDQTKEAQFTDRYTKAIEQLGDERIEIRLGGIYALERIAKDSPRDYWTVMEVLTAYVRERAGWKNGPFEPKHGVIEDPNRSGVFTPHVPFKPPIDIQAVITVLSRREHCYGHGESQGIDLSGTDLRGMRFYKSNLDQANLINAHLDEATFIGASAKYALFHQAAMRGCHFVQQCDLTGAKFHATSLKRALFYDTCLSEAEFELNCNLEGANLNDADLTKADMRGALNIKPQRVNSRFFFSGDVKWPGDFQQELDIIRSKGGLDSSFLEFTSE